MTPDLPQTAAAALPGAPVIDDASDNDPDDQLTKVLTNEDVHYPQAGTDVAALKELCAYYRYVAKAKTVKAVFLAIVSAVALVGYTWILLNAGG